VNGIASATVQANAIVGGNTVTASTDTNNMVTFGLTAGDAAPCAATISVTSSTDAGPGTLRQPLADVCPGGTIDLTPMAGQTIALSAGAGSYNFSGRLYIGHDLTILGHGVTISGTGHTRIFFVEAGNVTIGNLTLANALGLGGSSQYGDSGAGMDGAVFQNGGSLTLSAEVLSNNTAPGGSPDSSGNTAGGGFGDGAGGIQQTVGGSGGLGGGGAESTGTLFSGISVEAGLRWGKRLRCGQHREQR